MVLSMGALSLASSIESEQPGLAVTMDAELGAYLTDSTGRALYVQRDQSGCSEGCLEDWTPFIGAELSIDANVEMSKVGEVLLVSGEHQVTYSGYPLYYYNHDKTPRETNGHTLDNHWFLVSVDGLIIETNESEDSDDLYSELMSEGSVAFSATCAACHGRSGEGGAGPALAGHFLIRDTNFLLGVILDGIAGMPPHRELLNDRE